MGSQSTISNYRKIANIIKQMSGQSNIITVPRIYIEFTGDLTTAVVLNQIVFWSDKTKRTDGFFYKSYKEWTEETCLTERQVRYAVKKLKELGFLQTELKRANSAPTVHYKLDFDKLLESILTKCQDGTLQNVRNEPDKMSETLTEITTENTTDKSSSCSSKGESILRDEQLAALTKFYDENIQRMTGYIHECIVHILKKNDPDLVMEAFKIAAKSQPNKPINYIEGILEKWHNQSINNLQDLKAKESREQNARNQRSSKQSSRTTEDDFSL